MLADNLMLMILGIALWRRPSIVTVALAISWGAGVFFGLIRQHEHLRPLLMANDAMLIAVLALTRKWERNEYLARMVAYFSAASVLIGLWSGLEGWSWNTYAASINTIAILQGLFAGGFADGLMAWLGHRYFERDPKRRLHRIFLGVFR